MVKRFGLVLAGIVLGGLVALQLPSAARDASADTPAGRTVTVTGTATISAKPDEALVSLGVHTEATSAQEAMDQNAAKMNSVFDALKALGLTDADIETTGLDLYPRWDNQGETILGYRAENRIDVTIRDLGTVGKVIDTAVAAGANLSNGITFRVSDDNAGLDDALARAVEDARTKADAMAGAADAQVGQVVTIDQQGNNGGPQVYDAALFKYAADAPTPINPGNIETDVTVSVTWSLV
jgi:uncharacterized protein